MANYGHNDTVKHIIEKRSKFLLEKSKIKYNSAFNPNINNKYGILLKKINTSTLCSHSLDLTSDIYSDNSYTEMIDSSIGTYENSIIDKIENYSNIKDDNIPNIEGFNNEQIKESLSNKIEDIDFDNLNFNDNIDDNINNKEEIILSEDINDYNTDITFDENDVLEEIEDNINTISETNRGCPICFDINSEPGYNIFKGNRILLTPNPVSKLFINSKYSNAYINREYRPFLVEPEDYDIDMIIEYYNIFFGYNDKNTNGYIHIRLFNDDFLINEKDYAVYINDKKISNNTTVLTKLYNINGYINIKLITKIPFTHLELVYYTDNSFIPLEISKRNENLDYSILDNEQDVTISIPTDIPVSPEDLIYIINDDKLLKVKDVTEFGRMDFGLDLGCRIIQMYEKVSLLKFKGYNKR